MSSAATATRSECRAVAPAWHTLVVLAVLFGISLLGAQTGSLPFVSSYGRVGGYALVIAVEWAVVGFIGYGVRRRGSSLRELIGGSWPRFVTILRDLGLAIAFLLVSQVVLGLLGYLLKSGQPNAAIRNLLPRTSLEVAVYLLLTATAGFCEELIYRGYLQRQFTALTGLAGGIVLQGIAFGASHGYQGWKLMLVISVFGCLFGLMAHWRRSLRPGMLAHFIQDSVGGLVLRHVLR